MFKYLRKYKKSIACLLIALFASNLFQPIIGYTLSTGPEQVEYTSYESVGATDMVNLLTGDFTWTMPLLDIPGPDGSFPVPLFYHAGITPEQDASWVGLGFNLNIGCITRSIVGYNDDAYDQNLSVNVNDPGGSGWVKNYVFYKRSFDSEKGYGGGISLLDIVGAEWDNSTGLKSGTAIGMNFNKDGIKGYWAENVFNVANVAMSIASMGSSLAGTGGSTAKYAAMDLAMDVVGIGSTLFQGYLNQGTFSSRYFNWDQSIKVSNLGFKTNYKYWLDDTRIERAFGALYLGSTERTSLDAYTSPPDYNTLPGYKVGTSYPRIFKIPYELKPAKAFIVGTDDNFNTGIVASDMYLNVRPFDNYSQVIRPSHISYDQFNVMSTGVSGQISPHRLEIGSVSQPKRLSQWNNLINLIPFIEEDNESNKVQFSYNGQFSNKYLYHDDPSFGIEHSTYDAAINTTYDKQGVRYMRFEITNDKFLGGDRSEVDPTRIKGKKIVAGKNVEWYSNEEISSGTARANGYIEYPRSGEAPAKGIGGFSITKEDGVTYHYGLPVYKTLEIDLIGKKDEEQQKYSRALNQDPVAITWLLTAMTGPDFVDRGTVGQLDDEDWGYWVKFNYGKTTNDYWYRFPYYGYHDDGTSVSYSQGKREQHYLNAIETRSHKAIFIKGVRTDGLSSYLKENNPAFGHNTEIGLPNPTPPLFLDEIVLFTKTDFNTLVGMGFSENINSSLGIAGLPAVNGTLATVYDKADVQTSYRAFIDSKAIRKIKFIYETNESLKLCKKSLNSFSNLGAPPAVDASDIYDQKQGKLTLTKIQFFGRNSTKVFPDYKFEYGYNPDYNKNHWDGWGYYNPSGTSSMSSHKASQVDLHGAAWSLSKITLPTSGIININYQRDTYSSISGERILSPNRISYGYDNLNQEAEMDVYLNRIKPISPSGGLNVGDKVIVSGQIEYTCDDGLYYSPQYNSEATIISISSGYIYLSGSNYAQVNCSGADIITNWGTITPVLTNKKGGDIRVSEISYVNEFGELIKTKYTYSKEDNTTSSGVVSKEPELIKDSSNPNNFGLDYIYDYPSTPVLYSRVTVHTGYNKVSNGYSGKQVFEFETPHKDMVIENSSTIADYLVPGFHYRTGNDLESDDMYFKQYQHKIDVKVSQIGKLKSIKICDSNDVPKESFAFDYSENPPEDQGKFTSGSILCEVASQTSSFHDPHVMKLIKTTKTYHPYVLSKITHSKDGFTDVKEYKEWDFFTGVPTITETTTAGNFKTREEILPAYRAQYASGSTAVKPYASMGLKGFDANNKNMLAQIAAKYVYALNNSNEILGLIGADIQTWKGDWPNYRSYNLTTKLYEDISEGPSTWRKSGNFTWIGDYSRLRPEDGVMNFDASDKYNFNPSSTNNLWRKLSTIDRYDHFSMPLQATDFNNISSSVKMGYGNKYKIAETTNARFNEFAFSGAEDEIPGIGYFGGEVAKKNDIGNATVVRKSFGADTHTGDCALSISAGYGFVFKSNGLGSNKIYRASVWTNSTNGRIYYKINGGNEVLSDAPVEQKKVGNWYLLDMEIPSQSTSFNIEVGVKTNSGTTTFFDDFRFQPANAVMSCFIYDDFYQLSYILNNDNFYTNYEYDGVGQLIRVYNESLKYGVKKVIEYRSNFRRFHVDQ